MAKPSKKGAKSEAEVSADARKKKEILAKVAESNLPTKTILKELGISRSTYYSWLKRHDEEGEEGLLDSRSLAKPQDGMAEAAVPAEEVEPKPAEDVAEVEVEVESPAEPVIEAVSEEESPPTPEPPPVRMEEPVVAPIEEEIEEEVIEPKLSVVAGGDEPRKGRGGYAFIAIMFLVVGLLVSISLSNRNSYQLRESGNTLTLWKGKFAPTGSEMVGSFEPLVVADGEDVSALTDRTYTGKAAVYNAVYAFFIDQVNEEAGKGPDADTGKINRLLDRAEGTVNGNPNGDLAAANMRLQLAQKRVAIAELGLQKAYQKALPVYEEAMKVGLGDAPMLESKVEAMQKALGQIPVEVEEEAALEAETVATPEASTEEKEPEVVGTEEETEAEAAVTEDETEAAARPTQRDIEKPMEDLVKRWRGEK